MPIYHCDICNHYSDQHSHHLSHIRAKKHMDCKRILELELSNQPKETLLSKYNTFIVSDILNKQETSIIKKEKASDLIEHELVNIPIIITTELSLSRYRKEQINNKPLLSLLNKLDEINLFRTEEFNISVRITPKYKKNPYCITTYLFKKCRSDYEIKELGSFCEVLQKSNRDSSFEVMNGNYNFYDFNMKKCNVADYNEEALIIPNKKGFPIYIDCNFSCSYYYSVITSKNKNMYFFYILNNIFSNYKSHSLLDIDDVLTMKLPIPKSYAKIEYWVDKFSVYNEKNRIQNQIHELEVMNHENDQLQELKNEYIKLTELYDSYIKEFCEEAYIM